MAKRRLKRTRYGLAEDPTGYIVCTEHGSPMECTGAFWRELPAGIMLRTRRFNGEPGPNLCSGAVYVLEPDAADFTSADPD